MRRLDELLGCGAAGAVALVERERQLGYAELDGLVSTVAGNLAGRIAAGDRVAVWLPKSIEAVVALLAISRAGGVMVPVNPALRGPQVAHILEDSGAALLLTHAARAVGVSHGQVLTLEADWAGLSAGGGGAVHAAGELAALLYTSGSTGRPKGVMVTHANLWAGAESVSDRLGTAADDRVLAALPLSFDFGFSQLTTAWRRGARAVLLDYLAPRDVVRAVARHGITQLGAVPPLWVQLAGLDWRGVTTLRTLSNTGGRLPVPVVRQLRAMFPQAKLHLMFGLTEAFRATMLPPELADAHPDSIGRAIPGAEVLVCRADGSLADDDEPGELVQMGPHVTRGYWRDAERTVARFRPAPAASVLGGMAVWSGDTVRRDAAGLLYFVGRADETIKTMGMRVSPTEVEELAHASGAVRAAAAFGVEDAVAGQVIRLFAVPEGDDAGARLRAFFKREAPGHLMPADIIWREALPLSANGKIDRAALRAEA
ncbi:AMP-binding protein [Sandaracinobacteroides saxicola]|uniref:AMP-binding protein n=1 Tax=Sandaracinobacteroides saxicola TaxID=2759707 RepID=A0A7G5IKP8_9SPHN|nr:AMP-binding protein [Sandaracinobacteroides saxicola]QMW23940.1 AMP-binding protein [Sandaracinobacteroides saxicola]